MVYAQRYIARCVSDIFSDIFPGVSAIYSAIYSLVYVSGLCQQYYETNEYWNTKTLYMYCHLYSDSDSKP